MQEVIIGGKKPSFQIALPGIEEGVMFLFRLWVGVMKVSHTELNTQVPHEKLKF